LPYYLDGNVTIVLHTPGGVSDAFTIDMTDTAPGVFQAPIQGTNQVTPAVVRLENNLLATPSNPVHRGDTIVIYATGLGQTVPAVNAGAAAPLDPLAASAVTPQVLLGGVSLPVLWAGLTPGFAGLYQINAQVPWFVPTGVSVELDIIQGSTSTSLSLRVVD